MPRVLNRHQERLVGVYVGRGRGSTWGNPFSHLEVSAASFRVSTRDEAIARYRSWLIGQPELMYRARTELRGKDLACWCAPRPCHADILLGVANAPTVAVVGSRDYPRPENVVQAVTWFCDHYPGWDLVSGGARGVDQLAAATARARQVRVIEIKPDWSQGRGAGMDRNRAIVAQADVVVAFWDGQSPGTANSIGHAQALGKQLLVVGIEPT